MSFANHKGERKRNAVMALNDVTNDVKLTSAVGVILK